MRRLRNHLKESALHFLQRRATKRRRQVQKGGIGPMAMQMAMPLLGGLMGRLGGAHGVVNLPRKTKDAGIP